jgi:hypothetical protein
VKEHAMSKNPTIILAPLYIGATIMDRNEYNRVEASMQVFAVDYALEAQEALSNYLDCLVDANKLAALAAERFPEYTTNKPFGLFYVDCEHVAGYANNQLESDVSKLFNAIIDEVDPDAVFSEEPLNSLLADGVLYFQG